MKRVPVAGVILCGAGKLNVPRRTLRQAPNYFLALVYYFIFYLSMDNSILELKRQKQREANARYNAKHPKAAVIATQKWRAKNLAKVKAYAKRYRREHPEKIAETKKRWYSQNPDKRRAMCRAYRAKNPEKCLAAQRRYQKANREKVRQWARECYARNPENAKRLARERRAKIKAMQQGLSRGLTTRLIVKQLGQCAICKCDLAVSGYHLDHIIPLAKGGVHKDENIQLLCPTCNHSKGAR